MPTVVEVALWDAMKENKFDIAKKLIQDNPKDELFNSNHPQGLSVLIMCFLKRPLPLDFLLFLAEQPKLNLQYQNPETTKTNISTLIWTASLEVFSLFEKRTDIIFNCGALSYVQAKESLVLASRAHALHCKKKPDSEFARESATKIEGIKQIFARIRELTIHHAINTDDSSLLERLEMAGDDLDKPLSNGLLPRKLLKPTNIKLGLWFENRSKSSSESGSAMSETDAAEMVKAMEFFKRSEVALREMTADHHKKQAALYQRGGDDAGRIVRAAARSIKKEDAVVEEIEPRNCCFVS